MRFKEITKNKITILVTFAEYAELQTGKYPNLYKPLDTSMVETTARNLSKQLWKDVANKSDTIFGYYNPNPGNNISSMDVTREFKSSEELIISHRAKLVKYYIECERLLNAEK